jgi:hypothetical protein
MLSVRDNQIPRKKGYAMKSISRKAPGSIKIMPRLDSRSRNRLKDRRPYLSIVPPLLETVSRPIISLSTKGAVVNAATTPSFLQKTVRNTRAARTLRPVCPKRYL